MDILNKNMAAVFPCRFYKGEDTQNYVELNLELVGSYDKDKKQPIQNLRVSTDGTVVNTTKNLDYDVGDRIFFINRFWYITAVNIDLTAINPQAIKAGNFLDNAIFQLTLVAVKSR